MITHLLDTSALLAHYFDEPGAESVDRLWRDAKNRLGMCVLSLPEFKTRLTAEVGDPAEVRRVFELYANELLTTVAVDRRVGEEAIVLREAATERLPLVDAVIAACAKRAAAILVHCDPHFSAIPPRLLSQLRIHG